MKSPQSWNIYISSDVYNDTRRRKRIITVAVVHTDVSIDEAVDKASYAKSEFIY